jgi:ribonuclease P protein component
LYTWDKTGAYPALMAVSVPKRLFKRAVDRNLLKRRIREAYRRQKPDFYLALSTREVQLELVIQYRGRKMADYREIETALTGLLERVVREG